MHGPLLLLKNHGFAFNMPPAKQTSFPMLPAPDEPAGQDLELIVSSTVRNRYLEKIALKIDCGESGPNL